MHVRQPPAKPARFSAEGLSELGLHDAGILFDEAAGKIDMAKLE